MSWAPRYLRIPFRDRGSSFEGCDCYGLVVRIYEDELGVTIPDYPDIAAGASLAKLRAILAAASGPQWQEIPAGGEQPFDVALMRGQVEHDGSKHSRPIHIGVVVEPGTLIHIESATGVSIVNYRRHPMVKHRIHGFYRLTRCSTPS